MRTTKVSFKLARCSRFVWHNPHFLLPLRLETDASQILLHWSRHTTTHSLLAPTRRKLSCWYPYQVRKSKQFILKTWNPLSTFHLHTFGVLSVLPFPFQESTRVLELWFLAQSNPLSSKVCQERLYFEQPSHSRRPPETPRRQFRRCYCVFAWPHSLLVWCSFLGTLRSKR